jgi:hypothetical protein
MIEERWADVPGYVGVYRVSDCGRVYSVPRLCNVGRGKRMTKGRYLRIKPGIYPTVTLANIGINTTRTIHSLVLEAFVGSCPDGMESCHGDGDKWNCNLSNLRWDTPSGNHSDRVRHGVSNRGERCGTAKLTGNDVQEIRKLHALGSRNKSIALKFNVSRPLISMIINNRRWSYVSA